MDDIGTIMIRVVLTIILVVANAFFVAAEFAIVKVRPTRIDQLVKEGNRKAGYAQKMLNDIDPYLSATQLGITLSSLALGWIGEQAVSDLLLAVFDAIHVVERVAIHVIAATIAFICITFLQIVFGEMVPKTMAIRLPDATVIRTSRLLITFYRITFPIIWLLNRTAMGAFSMFGLRSPSDAERAHTEEELRMLVLQSHESGVIDETERTLFDNVFDFADRVAREIMVPRTDVICLYKADSFEENFRVAVSENHTRYPLCDDDKDHVIGVIHIKDLYNAALSESTDSTRIERLGRPAVSVPESMPINQVLKLLQHRRSELAVVIDEYGGTAGIVTTEDILEELVGEIQDEFDEERPLVEPLPDGGLSIDALLLVDEVGEHLDEELEAIDGVDSIGGWFYSKAGVQPVIGSIVMTKSHRFEVTEMRDLRVLRLKVTKVSAD